jgi:phosphoribosyl 1,2-cyclic phosphate phosphodiesterase
VKPIKITFLGTGTSQGVPVIACNCIVCRSGDVKNRRTRTSVLVESESTRVSIDTGPDFREQLLREKITSLQGVVYTHEHKDHIAGLDEVRAFNYITRKRFPVYATERVQHALKREFAYIFADEKYPGIPEIDMYTIDNVPFYVGDILFEPVNVLHYKLPVKGFKINSFGYITDANFIAESEMKKLENLDVLVLNTLRRESHISHFTLEEGINIVKKLNPKKAYFTHISHQLGLHETVSKELPANIELAFDGLQIII